MINAILEKDDLKLDDLKTYSNEEFNRVERKQFIIRFFAMINILQDKHPELLNPAILTQLYPDSTEIMVDFVRPRYSKFINYLIGGIKLKETSSGIIEHASKTPYKGKRLSIEDVSLALESALPAEFNQARLVSSRRISNKEVSIILIKDGIEDELVIVSDNGLKVYLNNLDTSAYNFVTENGKFSLPPRIKRKDGPYRDCEFLITEKGITAPLNGDLKGILFTYKEPSYVTEVYGIEIFVTIEEDLSLNVTAIDPQGDFFTENLRIAESTLFKDL